MLHLHVIPEWCQIVCLAFIIGVIGCRLWFFTPSVQAKFSYDGNFIPGMWKLFSAALAIMIGASIAELLVRSVEMSGQPLSELPSVLPVVLLKTHFGTVWLICLGALLLLAIAAAGVRYREMRPLLVFMLFLVSIIAMTSSASGHASDAGDFTLSEIMDWFHFMAAGLWGGGLLVLSVSVLPDLIGKQKGSAALISRVASRFSTMAGIAVFIIVVTAFYNFLTFIKSVGALIGTPYGLTVTAKIILLVILVTLGAFNRYISLPLLKEWGEGRPAVKAGVIGSIAVLLFAPFINNCKDRQAAERYRRSVAFEAILIVVVLFCASLLRHEIPARHKYHMQHINQHRHAATSGVPVRTD